MQVHEQSKSPRNWWRDVPWCKTHGRPLPICMLEESIAELRGRA